MAAAVLLFYHSNLVVAIVMKPEVSTAISIMNRIIVLGVGT
jgi:hypothetical protein